MYYYKIAGLVIQSQYRLVSYAAFICDPSEADVVIEETDQLPPAGTDHCSGTIVHRFVSGEWFFHSTQDESRGMYANTEYSRLRLLNINGIMIAGVMEWFVRIGIECRLARMGYVSLHAAAVETGGKAYAFTAPSGTGKSTRANAWMETFDARLISGDRPLIDPQNNELFGVPWDGKEQCFRNVHYPLGAICEVRRSESVYVRKMSFNQKRRLLLRQCFLPMWDTETASIQIMNISKIATKVEMVRVFCGPTPEDARKLYNSLNTKNFLKEEPDMKAKPDFVLRNIVGEFILMPTGDNIGKFNGTILLNEVSAFVWEKLQNPMSRNDLLNAILDEFEVDKATASADLNALLETLRGYDVIEDD